MQCEALQTIYDDSTVHTNNETAYSDYIDTYWSANQAEVKPRCVFHPSTTAAVQTLVLLSRFTQCPFAFRSGGHAAFAGASNIEDGITVSLRRLNKITLAEDKKTVTVQPGLQSNEVYQALAEHDLAIVSGRIADMGVGGFTLGGTHCYTTCSGQHEHLCVANYILLLGGIGFLSRLYGFACDNVRSYEVSQMVP